ncbi:hypothetical protein C3F00_046300 [Pseudomonas sp. MWU13-2860]|nr:hypothetical protein C3F00_046300 [Pseudomonas sp. MWU13-2860]
MRGGFGSMPQKMLSKVLADPERAAAKRVLAAMMGRMDVEGIEAARRGGGGAAPCFLAARPL